MTAPATPEKVAGMRSLLLNIRRFICDQMIPDAYTIADYYKEYFEIGQGYGNLLTFGCFNGYEKLGTLYVDPLKSGSGRITKLDPGRSPRMFIRRGTRQSRKPIRRIRQSPNPTGKRAAPIPG